MLTALPCLSLEFGSISVSSSRGEPLVADARIHLSRGESIDNSCLSVGDETDFPDSGHILIEDVQLSLSRARDTIRITSSKPITSTTISIGIRVRCGNGPLTVRALSLNPKSSSQVADARAEPVRPGSSLTVRPGDSIYGIARAIFQQDESAVRNLALAIVLINPMLFPDGPRPLQIGEQLTIPDLRMVDRIAEGSEPFGKTVDTSAGRYSESVTAAATVMPGTSSVVTENTLHLRNEVSKYQLMQAHTPHPMGVLRLKLARSIDLDRSTGMADARRAALRLRIGQSTTLDAGSTTGTVNRQMNSRMTRIREIQNDIDQHLIRLESAVTLLQKQLAAQQYPMTPSLSPEAQSESLVATDPIAPSANFDRLWQGREWKWPTAGIVAILLIGITFSIWKHVRKRTKIIAPKILTHRERIDSMLEEAREAAAPLLGTDPALPTDDRFFSPSGDVKPIHDDALASGHPFKAAHAPKDTFGTEVAPQPTRSSENKQNRSLGAIELPPLEFPGHAHQALGVPETGDIDIPPQAATAQELSAPVTSRKTIPIPGALRKEMEDAIDSSRSMFSDIDRFITLGRTQNAISLLEFQISKDPTDRQAWIKMLAIYHKQAMEYEFERTLGAFVKRFES